MHGDEWCAMFFLRDTGPAGAKGRDNDTSPLCRVLAHQIVNGSQGPPDQHFRHHPEAFGGMPEVGIPDDFLEFLGRSDATEFETELLDKRLKVDVRDEGHLVPALTQLAS